MPGLTTDAVYVTLQKGAQVAAVALGMEPVFQNAPDANPVAPTGIVKVVALAAPFMSCLAYVRARLWRWLIT